MSLRFTAAAALLAATASSHAIDVTLNLGGTTSENKTSFTYALNDGAPHTVTATAWYSSSNAGNSGFVAAKLNRYSTGLGVRAPGEVTSAPEHATDNKGGLDFVLLDFGSNFQATQFKIGYQGSSNSSSFESSPDIQVWTGGNGAFPGSLLGDCVVSGCTGTGDQLVDQSFVKMATNSDVVVNQWTSLSPAAAIGRYVLFSGALGTQETNRYGQVTGYDAFKLTSVRGHYVTPVPEPETYALMLAGLGVLGFVARRRRIGAA